MVPDTQQRNMKLRREKIQLGETETCTVRETAVREGVIFVSVRKLRGTETNNADGGEGQCDPCLRRRAQGGQRQLRG